MPSDPFLPLGPFTLSAWPDVPTWQICQSVDYEDTYCLPVAVSEVFGFPPSVRFDSSYGISVVAGGVALAALLSFVKIRMYFVRCGSRSQKE